MLDNKTEEEIIRSMTTLNKKASEVALAVGVHACTDITGFGLLGHLAEMIETGNFGIEIDYSSVPLFSRTEEFAEMGIDPPGSQRNRKFRDDMLEVIKNIRAYYDIWSEEWSSRLTGGPGSGDNEMGESGF